MKIKRNVLFYILAMSVVIVTGMTYYFGSEEKEATEKGGPIALANFQKDVVSKASKINRADIEALPDLMDWMEVLQPVSSQYQLDISIKETRPRQVDIAIAATGYTNLVNACAELYSQGLRFQSIRLLNTPQPGLVEAESLTLMR